MSEAKPRRPRQKPPQPPVHIRGRGTDQPRGLRELPADFNALANGEKLRRRPAKPVLRDDRLEALIPGVANRDARAACDARIERMLAARDRRDEALLGRELAEAFLLGLWRGRNLIGFDALLVDVLGLDARAGRSLAESGARELSTQLVRLDDRIVATWVRAEAGLINSEAGCSVSYQGATTQLTVTLPAERADLYLSEIGKRVVALSKYLPREQPSHERRRPPQRSRE